MKRIFLLLMGVWLLPSVVICQKTFNGTVRANYSQNAVVKEIETAGYGDLAGDRFFAWIDKKIETRANAREHARILRTNGIYEQFMKIKGNKVVTYDTKGLSFVLFDADKDSIYTVYPTYKVGTGISIEEYLDEVGMDGAIISSPKDAESSVLGHKCKVVTSILFGDSASLTHIWFSDDIKMPQKYVECYMYDGMFGFPLMKSFSIKDNKVAMVGFYEVTEIVEEDIPDEVFRIPEDIAIMPAKKMNSYLHKGRIAKNKKKNKEQDNDVQDTPLPIIGVVFPEVLWDF